MASTGQPEVDTLAHLEDRIQKAVALVTRLRGEKETALNERDAALQELAIAQAATHKLSEELESLRSERTQVRSRLERLIDHIDQLGAA